MTIEVREARAEDATGMLEVLNPIIADGSFSAMGTEYSVAEQENYIRTFPSRGVFTVALEGDSIVGLQSIEPFSEVPSRIHVAEISTFVRLDQHRRGIGRALAAVTLPAARERGFRKILATIRADNPRALGFYREIGFETIGTARGHAYVGGHDLDVVMTEYLFPRDDDCGGPR